MLSALPFIAPTIRVERSLELNIASIVRAELNSVSTLTLNRPLVLSISFICYAN
jgi:hypothetical protein